ncbi:MAG TPA: hypothetical protein VN604_02135, partial [Nitrospirota bacterium]|nr:hypothetical protein [Nitrospirota bacterium]
MKTYSYLLSAALVLSLVAGSQRTALAAGGGSWSAPAPSDPDLGRAKAAIKEKNWDRAIEFLKKAE